jgi:hypothetical protein
MNISVNNSKTLIGHLRRLNIGKVGLQGLSLEVFCTGSYGALKDVLGVCYVGEGGLGG